MQVHHLMKRDPQRCAITDPLHDVARTIWRLGRASLPVCASNGELLGQMNQRTIFQVTCVDGHAIRKLSVSDVPIEPAVSCKPATPIVDALQLALKAGIDQLLVVDHKRRLIGSVAYASLTAARCTNVEKIRIVLPDSQYSPADPYDGWTLNVGRLHLLSPAGEYMPIQRNVMRLLIAFLDRPGDTLSRDYLMKTVVNRAWDPMDRYIDVLIGQLRRKFSPGALTGDIIRTIHGYGYVFMPVVEHLPRLRVEIQPRPIRPALSLVS
jgi:DNA-binding winged helix-turn-helix (wHTH) protein/predicted transcriptional regulator